MNIHRRLLTIAGPVWRQVGLTLAVSLTMSATLLAQAFLVGVILQRLFAGRPFAPVSGLLVAVAVLVVVRAVLAWLREVCVQLTAAAVKDRVRGRLLEQLLALGPGYLIRTRTRTVQSTTVDGVEVLENYFGRYLPQVFNCIITAGVVVGFLFTRDVWVAVSTLAVVLFIPTVPRLVDQVVGRRGKEHWQAYQDLGAEFVDELQGMTTVKAFNATRRRRRKLLDRAATLHRMTMLTAVPEVRERPGAIRLDPSSGPTAVAFEDVTFRYETRDRAAVADVSFTAEPGQTVAIVGQSGAGKSTIVALLLRFFDPDRGRITIGGTDIRDATLDSLREQIAVVSQDTYLFYGSLADNLRLAHPDATDNELIEAARAAAIVLAGYAFIPLLEVSVPLRMLGQIRASAARVHAITDAPANVADTGRVEVLPRGSLDVRFDAVTFRYRPGDPDALRAVSFTIPAGSTRQLPAATRRRRRLRRPRRRPTRRQPGTMISPMPTGSARDPAARA
ncbi:MAG: ABC transporter transmembrane domain-containing protein [Actinomycetota bacterium]|nr:ABC transporter transmembrane domain-containing protein [Actinomycetota bacterium]